MARCANCGLAHQCICDQIPKLESQAHIALLTHENELSRDTNTGQWARKMLSHCQVHIWHRKSPPETFIEQLKSGHFEPVLLYPSSDSHLLSNETVESMNKPPLFIVLDATWQEAKKMLNRSDWLKTIPKVHLDIEGASRYQLRRNQSQGHLCTLEVVAELLELNGDAKDGQKIAPFLDHYTQVFKADKSGHALKS